MQLGLRLLEWKIAAIVLAGKRGSACTCAAVDHSVTTACARMRCAAGATIVTGWFIFETKCLCEKLSPDEYMQARPCCRTSIVGVAIGCAGRGLTVQRPVHIPLQAIVFFYTDISVVFLACGLLCAPKPPLHCVARRLARATVPRQADMALPHSHCHDAIALLLRGGRGTVWSPAR